ncbi:translation initiation factor IF-2-like [Onychomys torridus]|uniref:translation initiation factor IF-2-like n=1 Tax=Onychomys torridus TaxID=38674 RepID=UPI00167F3AC8|nr:translation initiation factor IF-2-like [Onychomys torridus]
MAVNRSRPRQGRGPGLLSPPGALPAPAGPARLPSRPPGPRWGRGGGSPGGESSRGASGAGGGAASPGNGGLGRARARHERGPRVACWVKSGRATPGESREEPGSEVRAPGARRAELPHVNAASGRNLFVFHRASMLPY